jgi:hypothetical protein
MAALSPVSPVVVVRASVRPATAAAAAASHAPVAAGRSRQPAALSARRNVAVAATKKAATPEPEAAFNTEEVLQTLKEKWDATENKTSVALYAGGALAVVWASSTLVSIVNAIPLVRREAALLGAAKASKRGGASVARH